MLITRGKVHGTFLDMAAVNWAAQQSRQNEVPPFYLDRARRLLDPHNTGLTEYLDEMVRFQDPRMESGSG